MNLRKPHILPVLIISLLMVSAMSYGQGRLGGALQNAGSGINRSSGSSKAQQRTPQGIKEIFPPRERDWEPSIIRLSYDVIPLGLSLFSATKQGQSFQGTIDFDQYFLAVEYGWQSTERGQDFDFNYQNSGQYFSIGPEVNFLRKMKDKSAFTFGFRYGQASFSDELSFTREDTFFGNYTVNSVNPNLKATWMELTLGISTDVWKNLFLGYTVRYKVFRNVKNIGTMAPYDVPGFGLYEDNTGVQFNFYIGWGIQLREKELPEELKAKGI